MGKKRLTQNDEKSFFYFDYQSLSYLYSRPEHVNILYQSSEFLTEYTDISVQPTGKWIERISQ